MKIKMNTKNSPKKGITIYLLGILSLFVCYSCQDSKYNSRMITFFMKGNEVLQKEDYKTALRYYDAGIQIDSTFADIFNNRGIVHFEMLNLENALKDYNQAIKLNPKFNNAYFNRANLYFELADYDASIKDFSKVIQAYPDSAEIYFYRAKAYLQNTDYDKAYQDLSILLQKQPENTAALDSRGYIQLKRQQYQEAQKDLEKALSIDPKLDLAWANLGIIESQKENPNHDSIKSNFEKALQIQPDEIYTLTQRALYYISQNQINLAVQDIQKAQKIDPENVRCVFAEATLLHKKMQYQEAIPLLKVTQKDKNLETESLLLLAQCYQSMDKLEKSCEIWQKLSKANIISVDAKLEKYCL